MKQLQQRARYLIRTWNSSSSLNLMTHGFSSFPMEFKNIDRLVSSLNIDKLKDILLESQSKKDVDTLCYMFHSIAKEKEQHESLLKSLELERYLRDLLRQESGIRLNLSSMRRLIAGLLHTDVNIESNIELLMTFNQKLEDSMRYLDSSSKLTTAGAVEILYGLRLLNSTHEEVSRLVKIVTQLLTKCQYPINTKKGIGLALNGLQGLNSNHEDVQLLLVQVVRLVRTYSDEMDLNYCAMMMYGCRNLDADDAIVRDLLVIIKSLCSNCSESMQSVLPYHVAMILNGLRRMKSSYKEVQEIYPFVIQLLNACKGAENPTYVSMVMEGLSHMRIEDPGVLTIVVKVTTLLTRCNVTEFPAVFLAKCIGGLQSLSSDAPEVVALVREMTRLARLEDNGYVSTSYCAVLLSGFQNLSTFEDDVVELLTTILPILARQSEPYSAQHAAMLLYGMRRFAMHHRSVRTLFDIATRVLSSCEEKFSSHQCAMAVNALVNKDASAHYEYIPLLRAINMKLAECKDPVSAHTCAILSLGMRDVKIRCRDRLELTMHATRFFMSCEVPLPMNSAGIMMLGFSNLHARSKEEVYLLVEEVQRILENVEGEVSALETVGFMSGLSGFSQYTTTSGLIPEVTRLLASCTETLDASQAAAIVYCLRDLSSTMKGMPRLIAEITRLVTNSRPSQLSATDAANMIHGLRQLSTRQSEVVDLVGEVSQLLHQCKKGFNADQYVYVLTGLDNQSGRVLEVQDLVEQITRIFLLSVDPVRKKDFPTIQLQLNRMLRRKIFAKDLKRHLLNLYDSNFDKMVAEQLRSFQRAGNEYAREDEEEDPLDTLW